jgi:hypothetical protein
MPGAAARAVIVTRRGPHILPKMVAAVALVEISKEMLLHGRVPTSKALNSGTVMLPPSLQKVEKTFVWSILLSRGMRPLAGSHNHQVLADDDLALEVLRHRGTPGFVVDAVDSRSEV